MRWHTERKVAVLNDRKKKLDEDMVLTHPSDATQWKALDAEYRSFRTEPRNIRLGASTDGLNPFGSQSSTHSTWPTMVVHEEEVHTHEHPNLRAETARE
jgi:hypothetical protein